MYRRIYSLALIALATISLASTGCVKRSILAFHDHPKFPVTSMEVFVSKNYYVYKLNEHRFYMCTDAGDKLLCKRACGDSMDVECPTGVATGYGGASNVR